MTNIGCYATGTCVTVRKAVKKTYSMPWNNTKQKCVKGINEQTEKYEMWNMKK